jgi:hypothetical protein
MPNEKIVLKEEEKKQIIEKHKALVDQFNNYLPDELKIKYDTNLDDKLNDEKEVKYYKTLEKIKTHLARQKEIFWQSRHPCHTRHADVGGEDCRDFLEC